MMWLDRISGNSPAGTPFNNRSFSPVPRRSSHLSPAPQATSRPGLVSQPVSLSGLLTPSDSTTSLPGTIRGAHDSALKNNSVRSRAVHVRDPLEVLNEVLGKQKENKRDEDDEKPAGDSTSVDVSREKPTKLVGEIDFGGLSLWEFATQTEEPRRLLQSDVGVQAIQQCMFWSYASYGS